MGILPKTHQACINVYHFRKISNSIYLNRIIKTRSTVIRCLYTQIPSRYLRQINIVNQNFLVNVLQISIDLKYLK